MIGWVLIIYACSATIGCTQGTPLPQSSPEVCIMTRTAFMAQPIAQPQNGHWAEARCAMEGPQS